MNTEDKEIFAKMVATGSKLTVEQLKDVIIKDAAKPELPSVVFNSLLEAIEYKISENDFISFCEEVYK